MAHADIVQLLRPHPIGQDRLHTALPPLALTTGTAAVSIHAHVTPAGWRAVFYKYTQGYKREKEALSRVPPFPFITLCLNLVLSGLYGDVNIFIKSSYRSLQLLKNHYETSF
jgi:hypothetical protein